MGRMNVLYLADRNNEDQYYPLGPYIDKALHDRHDVYFFDPSQPAIAQVKGMDPVRGSCGRRRTPNGCSAENC